MRAELSIRPDKGGKKKIVARPMPGHYDILTGYQNTRLMSGYLPSHRGARTSLRGRHK